MSVLVIPIRSSLKTRQFDLFNTLKSDLAHTKLIPKTGDIIAISSKYVSRAQGRVVQYDSVIPSSEAKGISLQFHMNSKLAEIIIRESDNIFGGIPGFVITSADGIIAPNGGIDKSNTNKGTVILYPSEPFSVAEQLRRKFLLAYKIHVGIIIVDSRLMPGRIGTIGIAISCAGIEPTVDLRGKKDLYGNPLKVTFQAVADDLASMANFKMGEGDEASPAILIRRSKSRLTDRRIDKKEMAVSYDQCVYIRGLGSRI